MSLSQAIGQPDRPTPWLYRLGELALGLMVLGVGAVFAWMVLRRYLAPAFGRGLMTKTPTKGGG